MRNDPVLSTQIIVGMVQGVLMAALVLGWVQLQTSVMADFVAMLAALFLPILGALYARSLLNRQEKT